MGWGLVGLLGVLAALLQVAGYAVYIRHFLRKSIRPNAASFLMFSYGTWLLVFLEWRAGASWPVLALPMACAAMGIVVALMCLRRGATEPVDRFEAVAFSADLWLTIIYAWFALGLGDASGIAIPLLIVGNATTVTCFIPVVRSTWHSPYRELPGPWLIWTAAYGMLAIVTLLGGGLSNPVLLLYPILSFLLHGAIAILSLRDREGGLVFRLGRSWHINRSRIDGLGVFAARRFAAGEPIMRLQGRVKRGYHDPEHGPNWIGFGPNAWIDPSRPLDTINHSCEPNARFGRGRMLEALREIAVNEEITVDYSTTETDPDWTMACSCGSSRCRHGLHAIQVSFAREAEPPAASPLMQLVWRKRRVVPVNAPAFPQITRPPQPLPERQRSRKTRPPLPPIGKVAAG
jgi:hypothetical protein